ncbi:MAG: VTT domain-containing protein [Nanoarchaeota archaeon]
MDKKIRGLLEIIAVVILFVLFSYIVQSNIGFFKSLLLDNFFGMITYVLIEIISIVVAPVTTLPLISVASNLWGWFNTGILSIIGWTIGSLIAFFLARIYGANIIKKFISIEKVHEIELEIPKEHIFWSVVLLRIIIPVDILSYAIGLFSKMKTREYMLSTIIGITPGAFMFAYLGTIPFLYQLIVFLTFLIIILLAWILKITCKKCYSRYMN